MGMPKYLRDSPCLTHNLSVKHSLIQFSLIYHPLGRISYNLWSFTSSYQNGRLYTMQNLRITSMGSLKLHSVTEEVRVQTENIFQIPANFQAFKLVSPIERLNSSDDSFLCDELESRINMYKIFAF